MKHLRPLQTIPQDFGELFGQAFARNTDPDTSHEAAKSMEGEQATKREAQVLAVLKQYPNGLTSHGICKMSGLSWNTATPRIAPLVRKGFVYDSGERRQDTGTRRACIVWKAT
jgi:hypothetical protein